MLVTTDTREPDEEKISEEAYDDEDEEPSDVEATTEAGVKDESGTLDEVLVDEFIDEGPEFEGNADDVLESVMPLEDGEELSALDKLVVNGSGGGGGLLLGELTLLLVDECVEDEKEEVEVKLAIKDISIIVFGIELTFE